MEGNEGRGLRRGERPVRLDPAPVRALPDFPRPQGAPSTYSFSDPSAPASATISAADSPYTCHWSARSTGGMPWPP